MKLRLIAALAIMLVAAGTLFGQDPKATIPLWSGRAPGAVGDAPQDIPTLTIYLPPNAPNPMTAVIIMPGGGYTQVANNAGPPTAAFLNTLGVAAFVLKYRVGPVYRHPIPLGDAQRAIRLIRSRAREWQIAPDRVGVAGFSAGGHLAATASTHFDMGDASATDPVERLSSRPDFAILASAVVNLSRGGDMGSTRPYRGALVGDNPDPAVLWSLANETQVTPRTPPTFIFSTNADTEAPAEESVEYFLALRRAGVSAELHVFKNGQHGIAAAAMRDPQNSDWPQVLARWLRASGFLPR